jgi:Arc/MetJ family transcription regulator
MRTNIVIDDRLMDEAQKLSKIRTKRELVETALREFITSRRRKDLRDLRGKISFREDYDYKEMRRP